MQEVLSEEFAIWLPHARREQWSLLVLLVSIGMAMGMFAVLEMQTWNVSQQGFWLGISGWVMASVIGYRRFAKWASDPALAVVNAQGLAVHSEATGYSLTIAYDAIADCTYGTAKDVAWLRIIYPNGNKVFLRAFYKQNTFSKMAISCERHYKAYWLQVRLSQLRARR